MEYLDLMYYLMSFMLGVIVFWITSIEGQWWLNYKIFKKPAKILTTFHPGGLFKQELVVPKKNFRTKGEETIIPNWFDKEAPIVRKMGSGAHYLFRFKDEVGLLDVYKIERGISKHTEESKKIEALALERNDARNKLIEQYNAELKAGNAEKAMVLQGEIQAATTEVERLIEESNQARTFMRLPPLPPEWVTTQIRSIQHYTTSSILGSFLGRLTKNINSFLIIMGLAAAFSFISAVIVGYILFFKMG